MLNTTPSTLHPPHFFFFTGVPPGSEAREPAPHLKRARRRCQDRGFRALENHGREDDDEALVRHLVNILSSVQLLDSGDGGALVRHLVNILSSVQIFDSDDGGALVRHLVG
jgi:hypothetical protein